MRSAVLAIATLALLAVARAAAPQNSVVVFNNQAQGRVREIGIQNQLSAKVYALTALAQLLAINTSSSASVQDAQSAYAGHTVLNLLFPWAFYKHDAALKNFTTGLSAADNAAAQTAGRNAAIKLVGNSLKDGFDIWVPFTPSPPNGTVGKYQFTPGQTYALYPQLATTKPLLLSVGGNNTWGLSPHTIPSTDYTTDLAEVYRVGSKNSTARNQNQTDTVYFWADGNTTSSVTGHFNQIAQAVLPSNISVYDTALLYSKLNAAVWDASIAGWAAKYKYLFLRPITAIRQGDGSAANAAYVNANWTPELATPPHPEYPSGHSISAGAAAGVLANYFNTDKVAFTIGTEYPGLPPRSYKSFQEAVDDVGISRVYAGVHYRNSVDDGASLGAQVADYVYDALTPSALAKL